MSKSVTKCLICDSPGEEFLSAYICPDCKEAMMHYKEAYVMQKKLVQTTELDTQMFEAILNAMDFDELNDDELLEVDDIPDIVEYIKDSVTRNKTGNAWLLQQEGRLDNFLDYIRRRLEALIK